MSALIAIVFVLAGTQCAEAHGAGDQIAYAVWTLDPWIVIPLGLTGLLYLVGFLKLQSRIGEGRERLVWRAAAFGCGWLTLVGALVSPLHWLGEHLFTFHMIEHEIFMGISAPLVVVARPIGILIWGLPRRLRRPIAAALSSRAVRSGWDLASRGAPATILHGIAIWIWHVPMLFDAAVIDTSLHRLQHLSFFVTAVLFWWSVLWRSDRGVAAWHVFLTMLHTSALGALMAFAPRLLYVAQTRTAEAWGLTPLEDQQLAGVVMWIPAGTIYAGAALALFALWIASSSKEETHVVRADGL
jgi:cytochrome c oxidase assembly factor CtaG